MKKIIASFTALMMVLMLAVSFTASADNVISPGLESRPKVTGASSNQNAGTVTTEELEDGSVRLTAHPSEGQTFDKWEIEGDYTIVDGDLNSSVIVIKASKDTHAVAYFKDVAAGKPGSGAATSPDTGDHTGSVVLVVLMALAGAAVVCKKVRA